MDCEKALEFLDCVRPNSDDLESPDFAAARAHMESCETCQQEFTSRQEFDLAIDVVAHDVDVPESLRAQLLSSALLEAESDNDPEGAASALSESSESESDAAADDSTDAVDTVADSTSDHVIDAKRSRRRSLLLALGSVACGIVLAIAMQFWGSGPKQFTVAEVLRQIDMEPGRLETFDESFAFQFPNGWSNRRLHQITDVLGRDLDEEPGHDVAQLFVSLRRSGSDHINVTLVSIPTERVAPLPAARSVMAAQIQYLPGRLVALAWQRGSQVYAVLIHEDVRALEELRRVLATLPA